MNLFIHFLIPLCFSFLVSLSGILAAVDVFSDHVIVGVSFPLLLIFESLFLKVLWLLLEVLYWTIGHKLLSQLLYLIILFLASLPYYFIWWPLCIFSCVTKFSYDPFCCRSFTWLDLHFFAWNHCWAYGYSRLDFYRGSCTVFSLQIYVALCQISTS